MRGVLAVLVLVAGCDALWRIDQIDVPPGDAPRAADAPPDARLHAGPYAHYTMDVISFDSTVDSVGGYTAMCEPDCPTTVAGHIDNALELAGLVEGNQRLEIAAAAPFQIVDEFTLTGWVRVNTLANEACLWSKPYSSGAADTWQVCINPSGAISFFSYGPSGTDSLDSPPAYISFDGLFHHVAAVYDGVTKHLYWDGELAVERAAPLPLVDDDAIVIGNDRDSGEYTAPLDGALDDVQFFAYALSPTEVAMVAAQ
jgi:hypothetical protein